MVIALGTTVFHYHNPFQKHYQKYRQDVQGDKEYINKKRMQEQHIKCVRKNFKILVAIHTRLFTSFSEELDFVVDIIARIGVPFLCCNCLLLCKRRIVIVRNYNELKGMGKKSETEKR